MSAAEISPAHQQLLDEAAIALDVARSAGVRSIGAVEQLPEPHRWCIQVPGIVFPWRSPGGQLVEQYRPDTSIEIDGTPRRYLWPKGQRPVLNVHPSHAVRLPSARTFVMVEGTKQTLAAVTAAGPDVAVLGVAGCYGWSSDGAPIPDLAMVPWAGRDVVVIFDADVATNPNVHDAATRLGRELELRGAESVRFAQLPGDGKQGLDDVLASRRVDGSAALPFAKLLESAGKLPKKPVRRGAFMGPEGLMVAELIKAVRSRHHLAVDPGDRLLVYHDGVYVDGRHIVTATIGDLLGNAFRPLHARAATDLLTAQLAADGLIIADSPDTVLVNVANGLLDPFTGTLSSHTHEHLSLVQLPVPWIPGATCPNFDQWLEDVTSGRGADLLEATALLLDMGGTRQRKAVFLHGPTRSGKSTYLRIIEALVGHDARSAVTLHDLDGNRFAAADLFGKILNTANELSSKHVDDLAKFKAVTGDDPVRAERKYGQPFTFRNRALFMFAGNEIPTVSEVSGAYLARIRPYAFPNSYEGREDPAIETAMLTELPGILVRLVEALRRFESRGGYANDDASRVAINTFARHSDRVRLFLHETTRTGDDLLIDRTELYHAFERWVSQNHRVPLGRQKFYAHLESAGFRAVKRRGERGFIGLDLLPDREWGDPDLPDLASMASGGQKGQVLHTPALRKAEVGGSEVERGCREPAPSAPSTVNNDPRIRLNITTGTTEEVRT